MANSKSWLKCLAHACMCVLVLSYCTVEREASPVSSRANRYCSLLCGRLSTVVGGLSELVQTPMPAGTITTNLVKVG